MSFDDFFRAAYGKEATPELAPFDYQRRLAEEVWDGKSWPDLLDVPTGLGKTAAVTLAWLYRRGWRRGTRACRADANTPRRLVWCLPMRVLVEQTDRNIRAWLENLGVLAHAAGEGKVSVHLLMGGADDLKAWAEFPEEDMILIGTQDMLLSRALMRGYGMSRYQWPVHFALLHNDALWVFDEVQLMGAGLATSAQLEAFRRDSPLAKSSRTLWASATLSREWLSTVDMKPHLLSLKCLSIGDLDRQQAGARLKATKQIEKVPVSLTKEAGNQKGLHTYLQALRDQILERHDAGSQTLVIVNRVERAQQLFRLLQGQREGNADLLIHARFRAAERIEQARRLCGDDLGKDRIIVATQAIEAGVDMSSKTLVTELAPWPSLVQRFGRCNRYGEYNAKGAHIFWVDIEDDADVLPYSVDTLSAAREKLSELADGSSQNLPAVDAARPLTAVLRRKDLLDLFNTDPDLSGFDVDVSDYIRDGDTPGVQVFWRPFKDDPNEPEPQGKPTRDELCPISIGQAKGIQKRGAWYWDTLGGKLRNGQWVKLNREPRPGMTMLLRAADGGYDNAVGFDAGNKNPVEPVLVPKQAPLEEAYTDDWRSRQRIPVALPVHLGHVAAQADILCDAVEEMAHKSSVVRAGRWHDLGKVHKVFDATMHACASAPAGFLAKSPCNGRHSREFFRHELASMLGWLAQHDGEPDADLIAYLIAAHHGKVRMSLRALPAESADEGVKRFARGVWEGDTLPALEFDGEHSNETTLRLALMEIGQGEQGRSWTERTLMLLDRYGPFQLAWLEALVRLADWRASRDEQLDPSPAQTHNDSHELDRRHSPLAHPLPGGAAPDPIQAPAAQSGAQHGLRRGAGGSADAGTGTRPPHSATRHLETTLGILSYAELAPHLARRVEALQNAIDKGDFDDRDLDESLFLEFHRRICADLTPAVAGRWRIADVVVGSHQPPSHFQVAQHMREYVADLQARLKSLPAEPDDLWLETLAFAEGRLLSIHPFADFNGRVARVFVDYLTRLLKLPDVDPTPDMGADTERYLDALRAADRHHWQPLMAVWRARFESGAET